MGKVKAFSESPEGKKRIQSCIDAYRKEGRDTTAAGSKVRTEKDMWEAVSKFIYVMRITAAEYSLPESVMEHINDMESSGRIIKTPDGFRVSLYFHGDLHRDSLDNDLGYEGIDNIVALFNNGYHAKNYVYGWWDGHRPTGESISRSLYNDDFAWVRSRKEREPLHFIQKAVHVFNNNYGAKYGVTAIAGMAYE